jgi:ketosteroid isomerase-like protein
MIAYVLTAALALVQAAAPEAPPAASDIAAEVTRGVAAYNAQDIEYYETALAPDAVYIADDGAVFAGRERVVGLFTRIFGGAAKPRLEVSDVVTGRRGDVAWARFNWALSGIEKARPGVATAIFARDGDKWQVLSIQNTAKGHAMRAASPTPGASPAPHKH